MNVDRYECQPDSWSEPLDYVDEEPETELSETERKRRKEERRKLLAKIGVVLIKEEQNDAS